MANRNECSLTVICKESFKALHCRNCVIRSCQLSGTRNLNLSFPILLMKNDTVVHALRL